MKKICNRMLIVVLLLVTETSIAQGLSQNPKQVYATYGEHIVFLDYSATDLAKLPAGHLDLAKQVDEKINGFEFRLSGERREKLETFMWQQLAQRKITTDQIANMSVRQVIDLSLQIVMDQIAYEEVDLDNVKHYADCLIQGTGDCDKYSSSVTWIFHWFKIHNAHLEHVVISEDLGGNSIQHAWNSILVFTPKQLVVMQVDPTFCDNGSKLDAQKTFHFSGNRKLYLAKFYESLDEDETSIRYDRQVLLDMASKHRIADQIRKDADYDQLFDRLAYRIYRIKEPETMSWLLKMMRVLDEKPEGSDDVLYYASKIFKSAVLKQKYKKLLFENFPDSYWVKNYN